LRPKIRRLRQWRANESSAGRASVGIKAELHAQSASSLSRRRVLQYTGAVATLALPGLRTVAQPPDGVTAQLARYMVEGSLPCAA
jgi:hypothetical protein